MNDTPKNRLFRIPAALLFLTLLLTAATAEPAEAQLNNRTAGVHLEYQNEHSAVGAGVQFDYKFSHRISAGITGALFLPDNVNRVVSNTRFDYVQNLISGTVYMRTQILRTGNLQVYGKPGAVIQRISRKGEEVIFGTDLSSGVERREIDTSSVSISPAVAAGVEWSPSLTLFAEPLIYENDGFYLNFTAGIRIPI